MRTFLLCLLVSLIAPAAWALQVETLESNGDPSNRIDLAILGDGYRTQDQTQLTSDANAFLALFWQTVPWGEFRHYFNVKLVHVISNENGADNGSYGATRDTALGAYFNCNSIDRLLCIDYTAVYNVAAANVPEYDYIFVIVNDPKYGGSGGSVAVFSTNSLSPEIALHEFGHTAGGLADEYEDSYPGYPPCGSDCPEPNVTTKTVLNQIKWNLWIDASTPLPTPATPAYAAVVGAFQGARYQSTGVYRPKQTCMMRALGYPYCDVCAEALVLSIYNRVHPIDSTTPASPINLGACQDAVLSVAHPTKNPDNLLSTWSVDGQVKTTGNDSYTLQSTGLSAGSHQVKVELSDETPLVRNDPSHLLTGDYTWTVNLSASCPGQCVIGGLNYPPNTVNPQNRCQKCDPVASTSAWTNDDSLSCDDGVFCNGAEHCSAGNCLPGTVPCTDDGIPCTDTCIESTKNCNQLQSGACLIGGNCFTAGTTNPQNPCQKCNPAVSTVAWTNDDTLSCDDGLFCNGVEHCSAGSCIQGTPPCADDGIPCTDTCIESTKKCNQLQSGTCLIGGNCYATGTVNPQNPCQKCDPAASTIAWTNDDTLSCNDGNACDGPGACKNGTCLPSGSPLDCDDQNICTADSCDPATGCSHTANPDGYPCGDCAMCVNGTCSGKVPNCDIYGNGCGCGSGAQGGTALGGLLALVLGLIYKRRASTRRPSTRTGPLFP